MPTKKKTKKSVAVVFGPGQISSKSKKALEAALQIKYQAQHAAILKSKRNATEDNLKRTKGITVKDLRKAIMLGLSYEEASEVASLALKGLTSHECLNDRADKKWAERLVRYLVEKNDHSLQFIAEEDPCEGFLDWSLDIYPSDPKANLGLHYGVFDRDHADSDAEEDADTLNQFILDFYGIDAHKVNVPLRIKEIEGQIKEHKRAIRESKREIKELESELEELKASL